MSQSQSRGYRTATVTVALSWVIMTLPWLSGAITIPYDAKAHFFPHLQFLATALHTGQSPFWAPGVFGGSPQIADPQSLIFSPAILLAYFDAHPSFQAFDAYVFLILLGGAVSVLLLFRDRGWHPVAAVVASLAFAFGASAAWRIQHVVQVQHLAFFALALWRLERLLARTRWRDGLWLGLACGLMIVEPGQVALIGAYVLLGCVASHILLQTSRRAEIWRLAGPLAMAGVVAILIAGLPILMTIEFVETSSRATVPFDVAGRGSLPWGALITGVIGDLYSAGAANVPFWGPPSPGWTLDGLALSQNMIELYSGALIATAILVVGVAQGTLWRREIRVFTVALGIVTLYALGWNTPVFELMYAHLPGVALFRRPADATFLMGGLGAIIGGYMVHVAATEGVKFSPQQKRLAIALVAGAFVWGLGVAIWRGHVGVALQPLALSMALMLAALTLLIRLQALTLRKPKLALAAVAGLMVVDLLLVNGPNGSTALPPAHYAMLEPSAEEPTIAYLTSHLESTTDATRRDRVELMGLGFDWPNASLVHGLDTTLGYNPLRLPDASMLMGAGDSIGAPNERHFTPLFPSYRSLLADMMGLTYVASSVPITDVDRTLRPGDLELVSTTPSAYIYKNPRALPRVMAVTDWRLVDFDIIASSGRWPTFKPGEIVLFEEPPATTSACPSPRQQSDLRRSQVTLASYQNTKVDIDADMREGGIVLLNDPWHPWWHATIDGVPTRVLRANVMFRAVSVPAGHHRVHFEFEPVVGSLATLHDWIWPPEALVKPAPWWPAKKQKPHVG